jgi:hypothetical protein
MAMDVDAIARAVRSVREDQAPPHADPPPREGERAG